MASRHRLSDDERGFLDRVARFCYSNPFGVDGAKLLDERACLGAVADLGAGPGTVSRSLVRRTGPGFGIVTKPMIARCRRPAPQTASVMRAAAMTPPSSMPVALS